MSDRVPDRTAGPPDVLGAVRRLLDRSAGPALQPIGLHEIIIGPGALDTLPGVLARAGARAGGTVVLLGDDIAKACPRTETAGAEVAELVAATLEGTWSVERVVLPSPPGDVVHADEATLCAAVAAAGRVDPVGLVTVGSGTLADIGKVVAQRIDLPHVVVQTAASVNGYADDQSVLLVNGTKRTTPSRWPDALVIDTTVLAAAPIALTRSGLGDQLSMFTAAADWRLAAAVGFDPSYSPAAVAVLHDGTRSVLDSGARLAAGDPDALAALAVALTRGGLAMGLAGRTAPSSGTEHTISHLLDMRAAAEHRPTGGHGSQVGVGSVVAAAAWAWVRDRLGAERLRVRALPEAALRARVSEAFAALDATGAVVEECWSAYRRKLLWINAHLAELQQVCDRWADLDPAVGELLATPGAIAGALRQAGAAGRFAELDPGPTPTVARWALAHCHLMRDRFTVIDLAEVTALWTPEAVDRIWSATQEPGG